ncbi:MAG: Arc family DNA-binding protein [Coxiellaceae bacterium]|nr:Arc family DNA-binding protein [Coxiellaceae bacterium]
MASFSIRKLDDEVYKKLRVRAAQHGRSMEEEVRQILTRELAVPENLNDVFQQYFGAKNGVDFKAPQRGKPHKPMDFD